MCERLTRSNVSRITSTSNQENNDNNREESGVEVPGESLQMGFVNPAITIDTEQAHGYTHL